MYHTSKVTAGHCENIVTILDTENSKNKYLNSGLSNIRKAVGSEKMSFIVTTNDPHNPEVTTKAGACFNNVLKHADTVK